MRRVLAIGSVLIIVIASAFGLGGAVPTSVGAPAAPIRAAFYYPWFPETWSVGSNYHPALGRYDSSNPTVIAAHIEAMRWGGISAGIASWWGQGTPTDGRFPALLAAASGKGFAWTAYYEPEGQGNPSSATIGGDLAYLARYASDSSWLRIGGKPVLFVYGDAGDNCGMADRWAGAPGRASWYIVLKVFAGYAACANQPDSWHQYGPAVRTDRQGAYAYSISPGFYKAGESSPRLARDATAWNGAVCSMIAAGTQWQLITTFNEWGEGTAIEPADEWQSGSGYGTYLDTLRSPQCATSTPTVTPSAGSPTATQSPTSTPPGTPTITPTASPTVAPSPSPTPTSTPSPGGSISHIVIVWLENHEFGSVTASSMPYLSSLAASYGLASGYNAVSHPSLPNYLAFWSGSTQGVTDDGTYNFASASLSSQLTAAGLSWRTYAQDYPSSAGCHTGSSYASGTDGPGVAGTYARKHNPAMSFTSVSGSATECAKIKPLATFDPSVNLSFVIPNLCNDAHDCSLTVADDFLRAFSPSVLSAPDWAHTLYIVTFDEGTSGTGGGGHVYTMVARAGMAHTVSSTAHNHYGLTRTVENLFGVSCLGSACAAAPLTEFLP